MINHQRVDSNQPTSGGSWTGINLLRYQVSYHLDIADHTYREEERNSHGTSLILQEKRVYIYNQVEHSIPLSLSISFPCYAWLIESESDSGE